MGTHSGTASENQYNSSTSYDILRIERFKLIFALNKWINAKRPNNLWFSISIGFFVSTLTSLTSNSYIDIFGLSSVIWKAIYCLICGVTFFISIIYWIVFYLWSKKYPRLKTEEIVANLFNEVASTQPHKASQTESPPSITYV